LETDTTVSLDGKEGCLTEVEAGQIPYLIMSLRVTVPSAYTFTGNRWTKLSVPLTFAASGLESTQLME
jgi:hypothetical protein